LNPELKIKFKHTSTIEAKNFIDIFLSKEVPYFDLQSDGFQYWHLVRFQFFLELMNSKGWFERLPVYGQLDYRKRISVVRQLLENGLQFGVRKDCSPVELLIAATASRKSYFGKNLEPYTEPWRDDLNLKYGIWEAPSQWRHAKHSGANNLFYLDDYLVLTQIVRIRFNRSSKIMKIAAFLARFAEELGAEVSHAKLVSMLAYAFALHRICEPRFRKLLKIKKPRAIVLVNHYDPLKMILTTVAKSLGVYVIEIQHGNMGQYHIPYNIYYDRELPALPDEIFTFGEFWNDTSDLPKLGVRLTATGFPFFEGQLGQNQIVKPNSRKRILFLSQDTIGLQLADLAVYLRSKLPSKEYDVLFKIHPREYETWPERYPKLKMPGIKVLTTENLYETFSNTDIHVGVYSTAIMESLAFGKKLVLFEAYGVHFLSHLLNSGRAELASWSEELLGIIKRYSFAEPEKEPVRADYFWASDSKTRILTRLREILS